MQQHPQTLHHHAPRPHVVRHPREAQAEAQAQGSAWKRGNERIGVWLTSHVGTMETFYLFNILALVIILAVFQVFGPVSAVVVALGAVVSSQWLQLVLLPGLMVGQNVQGRKAEHQADEIYHFSQNAAHDAEQGMLHLDQQDIHILTIEKDHGDMLRQILALLEARQPSGLGRFFHPKKQKGAA